MEFQAIKVLVIAVNMRSYENMMYTPAPDIVHESAGHAPFLIDIDYAEFLQRFGELGMQAVTTQHDIDVYNAVRQLSIVKEQSDTSTAQVTAAEHTLKQVQSQELKPSESSLLARLHWWTVEYGLVGEVNDYTIFGAGLLSSLAESESCLNDLNVIKKPLTVNAINSSYDITAAQPQLFVTESCRHMSQVLEEFGRHMCCRRGGASALHEAKAAASVNTLRLNSGLQVSGVISRVICDAVGNANYVNTSGLTQLAFNNIELEGQGTSAHAQGFGSPIGRLRAMERCLSNYTVDELKRHHIEVGKAVRLNFLSGICVRGKLKEIVRREQKNVLLCFVNCTVEDADGSVLFDPAWGDYDMAVGDSVTGISGGSADQARFPQHEAPSSHVTQDQHYDDYTRAQFALYAELRDCREKQTETSALLSQIAGMSECDWLLSFEALELAQLQNLHQDLKYELLNQLNKETGEAAVLIKYGLKRLGLAN
jgi:phenylalanine-4-hydroxylase